MLVLISSFLLESCRKIPQVPDPLAFSVNFGDHSWGCSTLGGGGSPGPYVHNTYAKMTVSITGTQVPQFKREYVLNGPNTNNNGIDGCFSSFEIPTNESSTFQVIYVETSCEVGGQCFRWFLSQTIPATKAAVNGCQSNAPFVYLLPSTPNWLGACN